MATGPYDPAVLQSMQEYIMGVSGAPSAPSIDPDAYKLQNTWATGVSKFGNLSTDLDWLLSSGQLQPGAFDPVSSYENVDAPGYRLMQSYSEGTPLQRYVSKMWNEGGKSAMEIYQDLQSMVADPQGDPFALEVIRSLPRATVAEQDIKGNTIGYKQLDVPDMMAAKDFLENFERTVLSDPEYTVVDGQPVSVKTEDSAARKAALEAGYINMPGETFDPWMLAPEGARETEEAWTAAADPAQTEYAAKLAEMKRAGNEVRDSEGAYRRWLDQQDAAAAAPRGAGADTRDWENEAPVVKAWWETQDAADSAMGGLGRAGEVGADWLGTALGGVEGLFRKKSDEAEVGGRPDLIDYDANRERIRAKQADGGAPAPMGLRSRPGLGQFPQTQNVNPGGLPQINLQDIFRKAVEQNFNKKAKANQGRGRAAVTAKNKAQDVAANARADAVRASLNQQIRQNLVNQMPKPFDLERQARNAFNYGRGQ